MRSIRCVNRRDDIVQLEDENRRHLRPQNSEKLRGKESKRELQILNDVAQLSSKKNLNPTLKEVTKVQRVQKFDAPPTYFKLIDKNYRERFFNMTQTESKLFHSLVSSSVVPVLSKHVKPEYLKPTDMKSGRSVSSPSLLVPQIVQEAMERNMTNAERKIRVPKPREDSTEKKDFMVQSLRKHHFMFKSSLARGFLPQSLKQLNNSRMFQPTASLKDQLAERSMNQTQRSAGFNPKGLTAWQGNLIKPVVQRIGGGQQSKLEFEPSVEWAEASNRPGRGTFITRNEASTEHLMSDNRQHSVPGLQSLTRSHVWSRKGNSHGAILPISPETELRTPSIVPRGSLERQTGQTDKKSTTDSPRKRLNQKFKAGNFSLGKKASKNLNIMGLKQPNSAEPDSKDVLSHTQQWATTASPEERELHAILNS